MRDGMGGKRMVNGARRLIAIVAGVLGAALLALPGTASAHPPVCPETWNPAMQPQQWTAVPGGWSTAPGTNTNGPQNSDGFFIVDGGDEETHTIALFGGCPGEPEDDGNPGRGPFIGAFSISAGPLTVKYTEANGREAGYQPMAANNGNGNGNATYIDIHAWGPGDMYACVAWEEGGQLVTGQCTCCRVPPPPF